MTIHTPKPDHLAERIVADLLDVRDASQVGDAVTRRVKHLPPGRALVVIAQAVGIFALLLEQIRQHSESGRELIDGMRNSLVADLVANRLKEGD